MKSFRAETPDRNKRQAPGQVTQDCRLWQRSGAESRGSVPGTSITVPHPRSYPPPILDRGESRYGATQCWAGTYQKTFRASRHGARLCPQSRAPRQGFGIEPANGLQPSGCEAPCKSMTLLRSNGSPRPSPCILQIRPCGPSAPRPLLRSTVLATPGERS